MITELRTKIIDEFRGIQGSLAEVLAPGGECFWLLCNELGQKLELGRQWQVVCHH